MFVGYSLKIKAYRVLNKRTLVMEETLHVSFDESSSHSSKPMNDYDDESPILDVSNIQVESNPHSLPKYWVFVRDHPQEQVIGEISRGV